MLPFDSGQIDVSDEGAEIVASYSASTIRLLVCVSLMMGGFAVFMYQDRHFITTDHVWVFIVLWLWLFGGNYITGAIRFPRWLRRCLQRPS